MSVIFGQCLTKLSTHDLNYCMSVYSPRSNSNYSTSYVMSNDTHSHNLSDSNLKTSLLLQPLIVFALSSHTSSFALTSVTKLSGLPEAVLRLLLAVTSYDDFDCSQ